jgi:hypothetical protein
MAYSETIPVDENSPELSAPDEPEIQPGYRDKESQKYLEFWQRGIIVCFRDNFFLEEGPFF